jgi:hypothetical protein
MAAPVKNVVFETTAIFSECPVCTAGRHVFPEFSCAFSLCTLFSEPSCQRDGSGADRDIITIATPSSSSTRTFLLCYYRDSLKSFFRILLEVTTSKQVYNGKKSQKPLEKFNDGTGSSYPVLNAFQPCLKTVLKIGR